MNHRQAAANSTGLGVGYTLDLTKAFQNGEISADDYICQRAERVGRPNLIQGLFVPFCEIVRHNFRRTAEKER